MSEEEYEKYAAKLRDPDVGGFSVRPATGEEPEAGYVVSQHGSERRIPPPATGRDLAQFERDNRPELDPPERYMGGWASTEDVLDVSRQFTNARDAYRFGQANAQEALYNVRAGRAPSIPYGPRLPRAGRSRDQQRAVLSERNERYRLQNAQQLEARALQAEDPEEAMRKARELGEKIYEDEQWRQKQTR